MGQVSGVRGTTFVVPFFGALEASGAEAGKKIARNLRPPSTIPPTDRDTGTRTLTQEERGHFAVQDSLWIPSDPVRVIRWSPDR